MPAPLAIGKDEFRELRELRLEYIDKTHLIQRLLDDVGATATLLPRPRRFGKTVNMTMLREFLGKSETDHTPLFEGLHIWSAGDQYRTHFQRYPTVFITFKNVKPTSMEEWDSAIRLRLSKLAESLRPQLEAPGLLSEVEHRHLKELQEGTANISVMQDALFMFCQWLERAYGEKTVLLIDEYDTPIHAAWSGGFYRPVVDFFRGFFGAALKGNPHLFKGVMTGILRISKESIFSDLNNLKVKTLLEPEYADCFGFTEAEVQALFARQGMLQHMDEARAWYNGYRFGDCTIYNPWSILNYLDSRDKIPRAFWLNSSSNDLIKEQLTRHAFKMSTDLQALMEGRRIERKVESNISFPQLDTSTDTLLSLLLFSGYLKAEPISGEYSGSRHCLSIPNKEVAEIYQLTFKLWLEAHLGGSSERVTSLVKALLEGDAETLEDQLEFYTLHMLSVLDGKGPEPEALYQGLMLGLCATLEPHHRVRSERESGYGRADLLILPNRPGLPGAVLELKVAKKQRRTLEQALSEGKAQLEQRKYVTELLASGASPVHKWVVGFDGKIVKVVYVGAEELEAIQAPMIPAICPLGVASRPARR